MTAAAPISPFPNPLYSSTARCAVRIVPDIVIPPGIVDHESFREWARSEDFPRRGRFAFFHSEIWTDPSMEEAYTHNDVKTEYSSILRPLCKKMDRGRFFADGMVFTNRQVAFTTIPDAMFISYAALESGRVQETASKRGGCVEFVGSPEMILEVVSPYSESKDQDFLSLYFQAGILEYWLVDVRQEPIRFDIFKRNTRRFVATRPQSGTWLKSNVFAHSFRLTTTIDQREQSICTLEARPV